MCGNSPLKQITEGTIGGNIRRGRGSKQLPDDIKATRWLAHIALRVELVLEEAMDVSSDYRKKNG